MAHYGKKAQENVKKEMHAYKNSYKWKNPKQAIAVGLSEARKEGGKVPKKKK